MPEHRSTWIVEGSTLDEQRATVAVSVTDDGRIGIAVPPCDPVLLDGGAVTGLVSALGEAIDRLEGVMTDEREMLREVINEYHRRLIKVAELAGALRSELLISDDRPPQAELLEAVEAIAEAVNGRSPETPDGAR